MRPDRVHEYVRSVFTCKYLEFQTSRQYISRIAYTGKLHIIWSASAINVLSFPLILSNLEPRIIPIETRTDLQYSDENG